MTSGAFITFEGIDGSGKSTQAKRLGKALCALGHEVCRTREPGGTTGAETIRKLLVSGKEDRWSAETEILLFTAARRDHFEKIIQPALKRGAFVICDRFVHSTRVYQGVARADARDVVDTLHALMIKQEPDLTFVIDANPKCAQQRMAARDGNENRFENFGLDFQNRLRAGFLELVKEDPQHLIFIDGMRDQDVIAAEVLQTLQERIL